MIDVIVHIEGGNTQAVYSSDPGVRVRILDYDNLEACTEETRKGGKDAERVREEYKGLKALRASVIRRIKKGTLHTVL